MTTFLFTWELGAGMGHLASIRPVACALAERGNRVYLALRDLAGASKVLGKVRVLPAPTRSITNSRAIAQPSTFADILFNSGFGDESELSGLVEGWRNLFDLVQPDVVIMDFSPTTLVALQGYPAKRVQMGTGYYSPLDVAPLPDLCPAMKSYADRMWRTEQSVLKTLNLQLESQGQPSLERVASIYQRLDANILLTFPELDHYGERNNVEYFGCWSSLKGEKPEWPSGRGKKVFAYLRSFRGLPALVDDLVRSEASTLLYLAGAGRSRFASQTSPNLSIIRHPLDMKRVAIECDLAILYGSHGTTCQLLLAGKPILVLPTHTEQNIVAERVANLGCGINVPSGNPREISDALNTLITDNRYAQAARSFADRHSDYDPNEQIATVIDHLLELADRSD